MNPTLRILIAIASIVLSGLSIYWSLRARRIYADLTPPRSEWLESIHAGDIRRFTDDEESHTVTCISNAVDGFGPYESNVTRRGWTVSIRYDGGRRRVHSLDYYAVATEEPE